MEYHENWHRCSLLFQHLSPDKTSSILLVEQRLAVKVHGLCSVIGISNFFPEFSTSVVTLVFWCTFTLTQIETDIFFLFSVLTTKIRYIKFAG